MDTISELDLSAHAGAKYLALAEGIRGAVSDGRLDPGAKLPPVRDLAFRLGVTPGTVARAYQRLTEAGVLEAHVGRGTFVAARFAPPRAARADAAVLDLSRPGVPDVGQVALLRRALRHAAEGSNEDLLDYPDRAAGLPVREGLLRDLAGVELGPVLAEDFILTHGAQQAYVVALQATLRGGEPVVATEALSYSGFRHGARLMRAGMVGIETDDEGPIPAALAAACDAGPVQVFATSSHAQNPTTLQTSARRRRQIADLARTRDFQIVEDECYGSPPPGMPTYRALAPERVWYLGSMSKNFSAALRVGYLIAPQGRLAEARQASRHNSFGISRPVAAVVAEILASPDWPRLREAVDAAYAERVRLLAEALSGYALAWREKVPFAFLRLPPGWRASGFVRAAEAQGVLLRPAEDFVLVDGRAPNAVRIAIDGRAPIGAYRAGLERLRALLDAPPHEMEV